MLLFQLLHLILLFVLFLIVLFLVIEKKTWPILYGTVED